MELLTAVDNIMVQIENEITSKITVVEEKTGRRIDAIEDR